MSKTKNVATRFSISDNDILSLDSTVTTASNGRYSQQEKSIRQLASAGLAVDAIAQRLYTGKRERIHNFWVDGVGMSSEVRETDNYKAFVRYIEKVISNA
jgi:hypothetical protein